MTEDGSWPETIPVTPGVARDVIDEVHRHLPQGWRLMPVGGTYMGLGGFGDVSSTTKDIDLVAGTWRGDEPTIPPYEAILAFAREHSGHVQGREDHTSVKFVLSAEHGPAEVEILRGRSAGQGGYFVSRSILEETLRLEGV